MKTYSKEDINEIWTQIKKDAQDIIAREALLEDLVDDVIIKSQNIFEAISKRLARKQGQNAIQETNLLKLFYKVFNRAEPMRQALIANITNIANTDAQYNSCAKVLLYSRHFQLSSASIMIDYLLENGKEDIALYVKGLLPIKL